MSRREPHIKRSDLIDLSKTSETCAVQRKSKLLGMKNTCIKKHIYYPLTDAQKTSQAINLLLDVFGKFT